MEQFDIINELRTYALIQGWRFIFALDDFETNAVMIRDMADGEHVLVAGFNYSPTIKNRKITQIEYNGILSLGRKFDLDGQAAILDETHEQKHDRRLKELAQMLTECAANVGCSGNLNVNVGAVELEPNKFDENIDFASAFNIQFIQ